MIMAMTTAEVATELGTTPRELRKFLRSDMRDKGLATPGKGARYAIERKHLKGLKSRFATWSAAREEARNAPKPSETDTAPEAPIEEEVPETDISLDELEGPTEDELLDEDIED